MAPSEIPAPPPSSLGVVHVDTLAAALTKLGITVSATEILDAVKEEEKKLTATPASDVARRAAILKGRFPTALSVPRLRLTKLTISSTVASEAPTIPSGPSSISYTSTFVERSQSTTANDPKSKERQRILKKMTEEAFPEGKKLPDPYTSTWLTIADAEDLATNKLPFIYATCTIRPLNDSSDNPPANVFTDALCLWDTGAQISFVLSSQLDPVVRENHTEGRAFMDVK